MAQIREVDVSAKQRVKQRTKGYQEREPFRVAVQNLSEYAALKLFCVRVGVTTIERKRDLMSVRFRPNAAIDPEKLAHFVSSKKGAQFSPDGVLKFPVKMAAPEDVLRDLRGTLESLAGAEAVTSA